MPLRLPRREHVDRLLSGSAGFVAACALAVSAYQAYLSREQQRMSAWPYLTQGNTGGSPSYARLIQNVGLGPALVRSMTVVVSGRPLRTWQQVGERVLGVDSAGLAAATRGTEGVTSSVRRGMVLLPGTTVELVRLTGPFAPTARRILNDSTVHIRVCYCSLYRECWTSDSQEIEPTGVGACPDAPAAEFES